MRWCLGLLVLVGCASTTPVREIPVSTWQEVGDATWAVEQGVVTGSGGDGYLISPGDYRAYVLKLEFWADAKTNSGVFIHCTDASNLSPITCYEINIWDNHPNQAFRTGAIVTRVEPYHILNTLGRWNSYEIHVAQASIEVYLNGTLVSSLDQPEKQAGFIGLQHMLSGVVRFRNLTIQPL